MLRHFLFASALVGFICSIAAAADKTAYTIKIHRDVHASDIYRVEIDTDNKQATIDTTRPDARAQTQEQKYSLRGRSTVVEVNAHGDECHCRITIDSLTDGTGAALISPGSVVDILLGEKEITCTRSDNDPLSDDAMLAFRAMYDPLPSQEPSDDEFFGSAVPRAVGDSWPINDEGLKKFWTSLGWDFGTEKIVGQTKLEGVESVGGVQMLRISNSMDLKNGTPPVSLGKFHLEGSDFRAARTRWVPVDLASLENTEDASRGLLLHLRDPATNATWDSRMH